MQTKISRAVGWVSALFAIFVIGAAFHVAVSAEAVGSGDGSPAEVVELAQSPAYPIYSLAALKSYAKQMVRGGALGVWSPTMVDDPASVNHVSFSFPLSPGEEISMGEVVSAFCGRPLKFRTAETESPCGAYAALTDKDGYWLLAGTKEFKLQKRDGRWQVPAEAANIELLLPPLVRLEVSPSIVGAWVEEWSGDSYVLRKDYLLVKDGGLWFPASYARKKGRLYLNDGTKILAVSLTTGAPADTFPVDDARFAARPRNIATLSVLADTVVSLEIPEEQANLLLELRVLNEGVKISFVFRLFSGGQVVDTASAMWIRRAGTQEFFRVALPVSNLPVSAGTYDIFAEWPPGGVGAQRALEDPEAGSDGGGGGKG